jgi:hypothetical protein
LGGAGAGVCASGSSAAGAVAGIIAGAVVAFEISIGVGIVAGAVAATLAITIGCRLIINHVATDVLPRIAKTLNRQRLRIRICEIPFATNLFSRKQSTGNGPLCKDSCPFPPAFCF